MQLLTTYAANCGGFRGAVVVWVDQSSWVLLRSSVILRPSPSGLESRRTPAEWLARAGGGDASCGGDGRLSYCYIVTSTLALFEPI